MTRRRVRQGFFKVQVPCQVKNLFLESMEKGIPDRFERASPR